MVNTTSLCIHILSVNKNSCSYCIQRNLSMYMSHETMMIDNRILHHMKPYIHVPSINENSKSHSPSQDACAKWNFNNLFSWRGSSLQNKHNLPVKDFVATIFVLACVSSLNIMSGTKPKLAAFWYAHLKKVHNMPWQCLSVRPSVQVFWVLFDMLCEINLKLGIHIQ